METEQKRICISYARVSSVIQTTEDKTGIERQLETAHRVAREKGWTLDEKLSGVDLGLSAYKGKNLTDTAALGGLLKALKEGKINTTPPPILIVEALDRITRKEINIALRLWMDILESGMEIYVDRLNKLYTKESLNNVVDLMIPLFEFSSGHEDSAKRGYRIKQSWVVRKRRLVEDGKAYQSKPRGWLKWNEEKKCYDAIPEKVKGIERLFELANIGLGIRGITKQLNEEHVTHFATYCGKQIKSHNWSISSVYNILHTKAVLGFNESVDLPIKMYPAIISEKLYDTARAKIDARRTGKYYGQSGPTARNLFMGLVECSECHNHLTLHPTSNKHHPRTTPRQRKIYDVPRGPGSRGGKPILWYLWCHGKRQGLCSVNKQIRYDKVEESFASMLSGSAFVNAYTEAADTTEQTQTLESLKGKVVDVNSRLERYTADYEKAPSDTLLNLMAKTEQQKNHLVSELEQTKSAVVMADGYGDMKNQLLSILYKGWTDTEVRLKLRELIRAVVSKIVVNGAKQCYDVYWKNGAPVTHVEVMRKAFKIDGLLIPAVQNWENEMVKIGNVVREMDATQDKQPATPPPATIWNTPIPIDAKKQNWVERQQTRMLKPLPDKEPAANL
jgi:hypothetical protein